jgi:hypothetical protein
MGSPALHIAEYVEPGSIPDHDGTVALLGIAL